MKFLNDIQITLENRYGAFTGLDVRDFVQTRASLKELGTLLVEHRDEDLNVAVLFDRDLLSAWESSQQPSLPLDQAPPQRLFGVPFEEVSHFVYLSFNHNRRRNITALEMELQSEVDRILLAFHGPVRPPEHTQLELLAELMGKAYPDERYEEARRIAASFVRHLSGGDPRAWTENEFERLRGFFHSDLSEKIQISRPTGNRNKNRRA